MTIGRAGELIRKRLAQKAYQELFRQFPGIEFKSFMELDHEHPIRQKIYTFDQPFSSIHMSADLKFVKNWFLKNCSDLVRGDRFHGFIAVASFSDAGWAEVALLDIEALWQIWEKPDWWSFYIADAETGGVIKFFRAEYQYEVFA